MNNVIKTLFFFALCKAVFTASISACSLGADHLRSSNYEMVRSAELIILATAESAAPLEKKTDSDDSPNRPKVRFSVSEVIKGGFDKPTIDLFGLVGKYRGRSKVGDFSQVRPGAMKGMCNAYDYKIGAKFLLFLRNHKGNWHTSGDAFSRINEEVSSINSPWPTAVKRYIKIGQLNDYEKEKLSLKALITSENQSAEMKAIVNDLENHFKTPSIHKSLDDLKVIFENPSQKNWSRQKALWAMTKAHAKSAEPIFEKLLADGKWDDYAGPISTNFASNNRKDMLPTLIDLFAESSASVKKMKDRENLSDEEQKRLYAKRISLVSVPSSILTLADEKNSELIFSKFLQIPDQDILGQDVLSRVHWWVTEEHPSLKNELIEVLEKMASSGDEAAKRYLTYLND